MSGPFADIRIIDCSKGLAGAMATMLFADFDAEVINVAAPGEPWLPAPGYLMWDRNKNRVELDLHTYEGAHQLRDLLATADVAVFDTLPGELERLGFDATTCLAANPGLVHAWLPPHGSTGRWSHLPPDELLITGLSGMAFMQFSFEDQPVALVTPQVGYAHATIAANAIAAALWERHTSGLGQALTVTGLHAVASIECGGAVNTSEVVRIGRNSRGGVPHYRLYRCADDKWFFLGSLTAPFFLKALEAIDCLDILTLEGIDGEFANLFRPPHADTAMERLEARFAEKPREEWLRILHEAGVPRGPVGIREEWFRDETVAANEMRLELDHPELGRVEVPGLPVRLEDTPARLRWLPGTPESQAPAPARAATPSAPPPSAAAPRRPLEGVCIIDVGAFIAGTFAPTVLANFGADVIKVEPIAGDPFRPYGLIFLGHNLGKRSLALDMKSAQGRAVFLELVRQSDVVLDNFRLGVRERLGIDYASLSALNPRIITCSVTGYGPKGRLASDPGFDPLLQARSGMMHAQGGGDEPVFHQVAVNDTATAMAAAFGIQAALHARERTGRGQEVHTCLANQTILFQSGELTWYEGRPAAPLGGRDWLGSSALHRYYRCADGWLALAAQEPAHFHEVCAALGHTEWAGRYVAEQALEAPPEGELATLIAEALVSLPREEAIGRLLAGGVPVAPALRTEEIFTDPWLNQEGFFWDVPDRQFGLVTAPRTFAEFGRSTGGFPHPAPACGEHSSELLREFGFSDDRIAALIASGAVIQS
ncbi:MAG: CoA transferase [Dehalococcoidia bacterium]|nr:CoA transferase [Dehalococcoidia bacterium]